MIDLSDFRKGINILIDGAPYTVTDFQHVKPGKGNQFTRTKMRNLVTGQNLERTFKSGEKFDAPDVVFKDMNFLYKDDTGFVFMDPSDYDQVALSPDVVGEGSNYLLENNSVKVCFFNERAVGLEFPPSVNLKVTKLSLVLKATLLRAHSRAATLQTGLIVQVPLHTNEGDVLKIDTRTGEYKERVKHRLAQDAENRRSPSLSPPQLVRRAYARLLVSSSISRISTIFCVLRIKT